MALVRHRIPVTEYIACIQNIREAKLKENHPFNPLPLLLFLLSDNHNEHNMPLFTIHFEPLNPVIFIDRKREAQHLRQRAERNI